MTPELARELVAALRECADELESEIKALYGGVLTPHHFGYQRYDRDMEPVRRARAVLAKIEEAGS